VDPSWQARRLGLNIPYEWWPTTPMLKEIEASGFGWVQIPSPPDSVLADPRSCIEHARGIARALEPAGLRAVLHGPGGLRLGRPGTDALADGVLAYAAEAGVEQIVLHARAIVERPGVEDALIAETRSLARAALRAERLGLTIAIENLAPVYRGPQTLSAIPIVLRRLVGQIGSEALRICLDIGHANVIAGLRRTALTGLTDPVLDLVSLFHLHDNLGGRWRPADRRPELDPLRLDLHLPPGRGTLAWPELAGALREHRAPLLLEVHPPHRPAPAELHAMTIAALETERPLLPVG
jgi:sugar phosphate isomerase/epimerase